MLKLVALTGNGAAAVSTKQGHDDSSANSSENATHVDPVIASVGADEINATSDFTLHPFRRTKVKKQNKIEFL